MKWSQEELETLRDGYKNYYEYAAQQIVVRGFERRSRNAIQTKASRLGIANNPTWTYDERNIVKRYYYLGAKRVQEILKNHGYSRSKSAIYSFADHHLINKKGLKWMDSEVNFLKENARLDLAVLVEKMRRNREEIIYKMRRIGLEPVGLLKFKEWTKAEDDVVRTFFPDGGSVAVIRNGVDATKAQIQRRAQYLGIRRVGKMSRCLVRRNDGF